MRMQKIKIESLKIEIESANNTLQTKENQVSELENKGKNISDETKKYQNQLNNLNSKCESIKDSIKDFNKLCKEHEKELLSSKTVLFSFKSAFKIKNLKVLENVQKDHKKFENESNKKNLRINRLQEEIDKLKIQSKTEKVSKTEKTNDVKKSNETLQQENQILLKQRIDLLQAFKKQLKLIDTLKRERTHLEAAQLFHYTQNEFLKALELGKNI